MQRPERKDFGSSRRIVTVPYRTVDLGIFAESDAMLAEAQAEKRVEKEETEKRKRQRIEELKSLPRSPDDLSDFCFKAIKRSHRPMSARDVVDAWYSHWRGRPDKPASVTGKRRTYHVNRALKWLEREAGHGRVLAVDVRGEYGAKRYEKTERFSLRRGGIKDRGKSGL